MRPSSLALTALLLAAPPAAGQDVLRACAGLDLDDDGRPEIETLRPLAEQGTGPQVLALVEARLLEPLEDAPDLQPALARWVEDVAREGHRARAVAVRLGAQQRHQDGRTLLALRELLRAVEREDDLAGVVLVGRFPDALLVRTCNWRKQGDVRVNGRLHEGAHYLRRVPEDVARRADVVLADLDGRWEEVYVQPRSELEQVVAVHAGPIPEKGGVFEAVEQGSRRFEDFFHVEDGNLSVEGDTLHLDDRAGNLECAPADRGRPNVMARPEVIVSRLDARGVALRPRDDLRGAGGRSLLDDRGRPRAVTFEDDPPHWRKELWRPDPVLERRLLVGYLDRNHAYRTGQTNVAWRPASIACDLPSGYRAVARAADDWEEGDPARDDVRDRPDLGAVCDWLARPAVLRTVRAHSDPWGSAFALGADLDGRLEHVWSWTPRGHELVPSLDAACRGGKLDWFLLHALWRQDAVHPAPAFYLHTGCHGISPPGARRLPYDHPAYGRRQGAEALLFFGSGLALVGRAKVFYDEPRGFARALGEGETFGAAWARYFELESRAESWERVGGDIGRKRAYFWSVLGDWTLRLRR